MTTRRLLSVVLRCTAGFLLLSQPQPVSAQISSRGRPAFVEPSPLQWPEKWADLARVISFDTNADAWDDLWMELYGRKRIDTLAPDEDPDHDGWTNYWEMVRFQDPFRADLLHDGSRQPKPSPLKPWPQTFGVTWETIKRVVAADTVKPLSLPDGRPFRTETAREDLEAISQAQTREFALANQLKRKQAFDRYVGGRSERQRQMRRTKDATGKEETTTFYLQEVSEAGVPSYARNWSSDQAHAVGVDRLWSGKAWQDQLASVPGLEGTGASIGVWEFERVTHVQEQGNGNGLDYSHRAFWGPSLPANVAGNAFETAHQVMKKQGWTNYRIRYLGLDTYWYDIPGTLDDFKIDHPHVYGVSGVIAAGVVAKDYVKSTSPYYQTALGSMMNDGIGMAPKASLLWGASGDTLVQLAADNVVSGLTSADMDRIKALAVSNHSTGDAGGWGTFLPPLPPLDSGLGPDGDSSQWGGMVNDSLAEDEMFGRYELKAAQLDAIMFDRQTHLPVLAAGNQRLHEPPLAAQAYIHNAASSSPFAHFVGISNNVAGIPAVYCQRSGVGGTVIRGFYAAGVGFFDLLNQAPIDPSNLPAPVSGLALSPKVVGSPTGPLPDYDGRPYSATDVGGWDSISGMQVAKNALTVGSIEAALISGSNPKLFKLKAALNSSCGPTNDGRIKPEIVAPGENVQVWGVDDSSLDYESGTSVAAPVVAGAVALWDRLYQSLMVTNGVAERPSAALLRALAVHTAHDLVSIPIPAGLTENQAESYATPFANQTIGGARAILEAYPYGSAPHPPFLGRHFVGPDYSSGYGLLDAAAAGRLIALNSVKVAGQYTRPYLKPHTFVPGQPFSLSIVAPAHSPVEPLKVTLAWTDWTNRLLTVTPETHANTATFKALTNDFDLRVTGPDATQGGASRTFYPFILNKAQPMQPATTGDNSCDNLEQIVIAPQQLVAGATYTLSVTLKGSLSFPGKSPVPTNHALALVITGQSDSAPLTAAQVNDFRIKAFQPLIPYEPGVATSGLYSLTWNAVVGRYYRLEASRDLKLWGAFGFKAVTTTPNGPTVGLAMGDLAPTTSAASVSFYYQEPHDDQLYFRLRLVPTP